MNKSRILTLAFLCLAGLYTLSVHAQTPVTEYRIYRAVAPITIDGRLDDAAWGKAPAAVMCGTRGEPLPLKTTVRLLWDDDYLYVGFHGEDTDAWTTFEEDDENLWEDEVFESFIDPEGLEHTYYEINVSPAGNVVDLFVTNGGERLNGRFVSMREWDCRGLEHAVFVDGDPAPNTDDSSWSAELAIPFDQLWIAPDSSPSPGDEWRANFYRIDRGDPDVTDDTLQGCFSSTDGRGFHTPWRFGRVVFGE